MTLAFWSDLVSIEAKAHSELVSSSPHIAAWQQNSGQDLDQKSELQQVAGCAMQTLQVQVSSFTRVACSVDIFVTSVLPWIM